MTQLASDPEKELILHRLRALKVMPLLATILTLACDDGATIYMPGPLPEELDEDMPIEEPDHGEPTQEQTDQWMQESVDVGFDPPEPEPEPAPPIVGPPLPPDDTVRLIPADEEMAA